MVEGGESVLRAARQRAGMTQAELALALGVSSATLSRAETGIGRLRSEHLRISARLLGVEESELDAGDDSPGGLDCALASRGLYAPGAEGSWRRYDDLLLGPLMEAALDRFLRVGYHGTSVRDIAKSAGLSVPGLYHHYASKQALLVAVMDLTMTDFEQRCLAARDEGTTAVDRFTRLVECFALFHTYRRELAFIGASEMRSLDEADRQRIAAVRLRCQGLVTTEVEAMAGAGILRAAEPADAARAVVTLLVGIANWYRPDGPDSPEAIAERYVAHGAALVGLDL